MKTQVLKIELALKEGQKPYQLIEDNVLDGNKDTFAEVTHGA